MALCFSLVSNNDDAQRFWPLHTDSKRALDIGGATGTCNKRDIAPLIGSCPAQLLQNQGSIIEHRHKPVLTREHKVRQCKHTDYSRFQSVISQEHRTRLSDSQFRARKTSWSIGNASGTASLAY